MTHNIIPAKISSLKTTKRVGPCWSHLSTETKYSIQKLVELQNFDGNTVIHLASEASNELMIVDLLQIPFVNIRPEVKTNTISKFVKMRNKQYKSAYDLAKNVQCAQIFVPFAILNYILFN